MMMWQISLASGLLCLVLGVGQTATFAAAPSASDRQATSSLRLQPTATCPQDALDELNKTVDFIRGQTWTDLPGSHPLNIAPDLSACRVVLHIGHLSDKEEAALHAGAGTRLAIEYRRDWARPSRVLLILWVIFGGSGLIWVYRRYGWR